MAITARAQSLDAKITTTSEELKKLNAAELDLTRLEREIELTRANYRKYSENLEQARIDQELDAAKISSLNLMQPPTSERHARQPTTSPDVGPGLFGCRDGKRGGGFAVPSPRATAANWAIAGTSCGPRIGSRHWPSSSPPQRSRFPPIRAER